MLKKRDEITSSLLPNLKIPRSVAGWDKVDEEIECVESMFRRGTLVAVLLWLSLLFAVFRYAPFETYEEPIGLERSTHMLSCLVLSINLVSRVLPLFVRDFSFGFMKSGFLLGALTVQVIAITSNLVMCKLPAPVVVDEISSLRFHLVRWAEWTPLAFLMTFLTCNITAPLNTKTLSINFTYPTMLALSTIAGMFFPFCQDIKSWSFVMLVSWLLFLSLYVLVYRRASSYYDLKEQSSNGTAVPPETMNLVKSAFSLSVVCSVTWTCLAVSFTFLSYIAKVARPDSWLGNPAVPVILTSCFEIASKIWYFSVLIDTYDKVFDEDTRSIRRLEELRNFMSAVWSASSDPIIFCIENEGHISARVSPAFLKMLGHGAGGAGFLTRGEVSLILEIDTEKDTCDVFVMDLSKKITRRDVSNFKENLAAQKYQLSSSAKYSADEKNLVFMAQLVMEACKSRTKKDACQLTQSFIKKEGEVEKQLSCEAKMAELDGGSCVIVLRDISDRLRRFEVEKKLLQEVTSRKKDIEANNFTRHEGKKEECAQLKVKERLTDYSVLFLTK